MTFVNRARSAVCIAALVAGNAAFAEVTAQDVWDSFKAQMSMYGEDGLTVGSEDYADGVLTVSDLALSMDDGTDTVTANMGEMVFTENGDGTVTVAYSEEYPINFTNNAAPDQNYLTFLFKLVGNEMTVSGDPGALNYDLSADRYTISLSEAVKDGQPVLASANLNLNDIAGTYSVTTGETTIDTSYAMTATSADGLFNTSEGGSTFDISGQMALLDLNGTMTMPVDYDGSAPESLFANGFAMKYDYSTGLTNYIINSVDGSGPTNLTVSAGGTSLAAEMNKETLSFALDETDLVIAGTSAATPFPIDLTAKQIGLGLTMPVAKTEEPADFAAKLDLVEVGTNDMIWGLVDPTGALPHDPITAQLDLTGMGKLNVDLFDPTQTAGMSETSAPGELNSLSLNALNLLIAGAAVTGTGAFTFDNTDLVTFGGMPRPTGSLDLQATGVNGLLDKLQTMGMIPEDQMMGARMMLGMFATVVGDDSLTSKLEVNESGGVFVNGQQIR